MSEPDELEPLGKSGVTIAQLRRAARLYHENRDAATALGFSPGAFSRLCEKHGIETPYKRRRRRLG